MYISATVPSGTSGVSLRSLGVCWSAFCSSLRGPEGGFLAWPACLFFTCFFKPVFGPA